MTSQTHDLHRALLRPFVIHTLRAAGFHGTKPAVLDTLVNIAERHLMLLASSTAAHARNSHNDAGAHASLSDVRMAMRDCGVLVPHTGAAEEAWSETLRRPVEVYAEMDGGLRRGQAVQRRREEEDGKDLRAFLRWVDGPQMAEIKRVAGMAGDAVGAGVVGVGGGVVKEEDFLERLKKRSHKGGAADDARLFGTVLGREVEGRDVVVEGGPVQDLKDWRPPKIQKTHGSKESDEGSGKRDSVAIAKEDAMLA